MTRGEADDRAEIAEIALAAARVARARAGKRPRRRATPPPPAASVPAPAVSAGDLAAAAAEAAACTKCRLCETRTTVVFGVGAPNARLMVVGEGPGADEDAQGIPFVGRAGQLLTKMLAAIDLPRETVYITNCVKCRPPGNRNPQDDEIAACEPYLLRQIAAIRPAVMLLLGNHAVRTLLGVEEGITKVRGRLFLYEGILCVPSYHPAYLLRSPNKKAESWEDLKTLRAAIDGTLDVSAARPARPRTRPAAGGEANATLL